MVLSTVWWKSNFMKIRKPKFNSYNLFKSGNNVNKSIWFNESIYIEQKS